MDADSFADFVDLSLQTLRKHLISAHPEIAKSSFDSTERLASFERELCQNAKDVGGPGGPSGRGHPGHALGGAKIPPSLAPASSSPSEDPGASASTVRFSEHVQVREKDPSPGLHQHFPHSALTELDEPDAISHGNSSAILRSDLNDLSEDEQRLIRQRLRIRIGNVSANRLVSGKSLHHSLCALGLTRYSVQDMNELVNHLATFVNLRFDDEEDHTWSGSTLDIFESVDIFGLLPGFDPFSSTPVWEWPAQGEASQAIHRESSFHSHANTEKAKVLTHNVVPLEALMDVFLSSEGSGSMHKRIFGPKLLKQFKAVKEILLAGDTNRLVAELTFVRINDLAVPSEPIHILLYLEPLIALIIVANGITIGIQTDPNYEAWTGWLYVELGFVIALVLELLARMAVLGCRDFWCGVERVWNWFDTFLTAIGVVDISWQLASTTPPDIVGTLLLRCFRLVRLARVVRVFRLNIMSDLRLMLRGLIAGIWTLALAFCLLFAVLYVIAGMASFTIGRDQRLETLGLREFFYNIPVAMFTAFRCFIGDCNTENGHSITSILTSEFGLPFVLGYVASYMLVAMGIFNVILAVYVDITMKAAKENDAVTAEQYNRESIRIARSTRELLKKFAAAYHVFHVIEDHGADITRLEITHSATLFTDDEIHEDVAITKELFLLVIQDPAVQNLMDELDLPPFRAHLFEVIDADGSGTLHIQELVQGLLKLRGEVNKGDVVAPLLATRSVQSLVTDLRKDTEAQLVSLRTDLSQHLQILESICSVKWDAPERVDLEPTRCLGPRLTGLGVPVQPGVAEDVEVEPLPC